MGTVAVIVLSHRGAAQVARLVSRISEGTDSVAVIHHDPTGEPLKLTGMRNAAVIPDPISCDWGRLSLVKAQWHSLRWVARNIPDFSWALLISGQDYPIRSMRDIERELAESPYDAYLRHFRITGDPADDVHPWQTLTRRRYLYKRRIPFSRRSIALPFQRRHPFHDGTRLYVGDMWFNLSAPAVHAMLENRELAERLMRYFRFAPIPDEAFISCMALNTDSIRTLANDSKRFIDWVGSSPHPELITAAHLDALAQSEAFFARKIDADLHPDIPDLLDELARARHH